MSNEATRLTKNLREGRKAAAAELFPLVYQELRRIAARMLRSERRDHSLQTTGLVHEVYLRMVVQRDMDWMDEAHFSAVAAQAMRRVLVDHARRRRRKKRGGGGRPVPLDSQLVRKVENSAGVDLEQLDRLLERLSEIMPRATSIVDMRFFAELTNEQIAAVLRTSISTVEREWRYARAWLARELGSLTNPSK
jgi:RNA polymerase sigma factor (TIGR02999 family)